MLDTRTCCAGDIPFEMEKLTCNNRRLKTSHLMLISVVFITFVISTTIIIMDYKERKQK